MTRKQLPKAIRASAQRWATAATIVLDEEAPHLARAAAEAKPVVPVPAPNAREALLAAAASLPYEVMEKRWQDANKIVDRHRVYAAVGGLLPLPLVTIASVMAINMRMVRQLSKLYEVPFERDRTRSTILGIMAGAAPTGLAAATASTLGFIIPGSSALFGLGVCAITAGVLTRGIGRVFLAHFETEAMQFGSGDAVAASH